MCWYERPGWPGYRDLGFCDRYLGNRDENFPYEYSSQVTGTKLFKQNSVALTTYRPKWHNFGLVCISSLGVCELALLGKLQDSTKQWQSRTIQVYVPPFWLCFLNSLRSTGLKFPISIPYERITEFVPVTKLARLPSSYEEALITGRLRSRSKHYKQALFGLGFSLHETKPTRPNGTAFTRN